MVFRYEARVEREPFGREAEDVLNGCFSSCAFETLAHRAVGQVGNVGDGSVGGKVRMEMSSSLTREISCLVKEAGMRWAEASTEGVIPTC